MSKRIIDWVLEQPLNTTEKLVLTILANHADASGECFPRVKRIAASASVVKRTSRRVLKQLEQKQLVKMIPRYRNDGSRSSNMYILAIPKGLNASSGPDNSDPTSGRSSAPGRDTGDRALTTNELNIKKPLLPEERNTSQTMHTVHSDSKANGSRGELKFEFPRSLLPDEIKSMVKRASALSPEMAQQALYELEGRMNAGSVRGNTVSYFSGIVSSIEQGTFTLQAGIRVRESYRNRKRAQKAHERALKSISLPNSSKEINSAIATRWERLYSRRKPKK